MLHLSTYTYAPWVLDALADRKTGIATETMLMPSVYQIAEFAKKAIADRALKEGQEARYARAQAQRSPARYVKPPPFRPFPRLWEAFADEPAVIQALDNPGSFGFLDDASRLLATRGKDKARAFILPPSTVGGENGA